MLYSGQNPFNCCVIGFHGAGTVPGSLGSGNSNGNAKVITYAWASYVTPGIFNPNSAWALQDIHPLSHEISEWADDPFTNNFVQPWHQHLRPGPRAQRATDRRWHLPPRRRGLPTSPTVPSRRLINSTRPQAHTGQSRFPFPAWVLQELFSEAARLSENEPLVQLPAPALIADR
jgi:hypothetical protein